MYFYFCYCSCWRIYLQLSTLDIGRIISCPKTSCPGLLPLTLWYMEHTMKAYADSIPIHGSASSTYVSCILYIRTRFTITWWILYGIAFLWGFPGEYGLVLIANSTFIKLFLNLRPINYPPFLLLYWFIPNHPVTGLIIVTGFNINISSPLWCIL